MADVSLTNSHARYSNAFSGFQLFLQEAMARSSGPILHKPKIPLVTPSGRLLLACSRPEFRPRKGVHLPALVEGIRE